MRDLTDAFQSSCRQFEVPGAQLGVMVSGDRSVWCAGTIAIDDQTPVTSETRFHAGSIAKSLAALLVLAAARDGHIDLDAPCSAQGTGLWDDSPRALMSQTSGRMNALPDVGEDLATFIARVADVPRVHEPGQFSYCNAGWTVLDALLRQRAGGSFEDLAQQRWERQLAFGMPADAAMGHQVSPGLRPERTEPVYADAASAAGSRWWATADELLDYARLHLDNGADAFDAHDVTVMRTAQALIPGRTVADAWGYGWALWDRGAHQAFGWDGYTGGHRAFLRCYPEQDAAVVVLANSAGSLFGGPGGSALFDALLPDVLSSIGVPAKPDADRTDSERPVTALQGDFGPVAVRDGGGDAVIVDVRAFGEPEPLRFRRSSGNTFTRVDDLPGAVDIAFDADLLYIGPFAIPRT